MISLHEQTSPSIARRWACSPSFIGLPSTPRYIRLCQLRGTRPAAPSLREGLKEMFTLQRLQIRPSLPKCLATTNIIESSHSGVSRRTHNVTRWRDADMAGR
jgi:hypothetical protein